MQDATALGLTVEQVMRSRVRFEQDGPELTGRELCRVLSESAASVLVVEHRDGLALFGARHLQRALAVDRHRVVFNPKETRGDRFGDITEILTSMCARLYRQRATRNRVARAISAATWGTSR